MHYKKIMSDKSNCKGCSKCNYYPYFHFEKSDQGQEIEFIKIDKNLSKVINHTTNQTHTYNGTNWTKN